MKIKMGLKRDRNHSTHSLTNEEERGEKQRMKYESLGDSSTRDELDITAEEKLGYPDTTRPFPRNVTQISFQQPTQLTTFSYSEKRELLFDDSALRYYVEPPRDAKLDFGYEKWVRQVDERGRIDSLLKALEKVKEDPARAGAVKELGVVSWRGVMTK
jgi:RAT1-interacting protein